MTYFSGRVHSIVFENAAQGFYILRMVLDGAEVVSHYKALPVVRGHVPGIQIEIGAWFGFEGDWIQHEQFGRQIAITKAPVVHRWTTDVAVSVLLANNVGRGVVDALQNHFGEKLPEVLDADDPAPLRAVPGLQDTAPEHILTRWKYAKAHFLTLEFLTQVGVPRTRTQRVWAVFKEEAEQVLSKNPWALVRIDGITFQQADDVAQKLGLKMDCQERVEGAVLFTCKTRRGMGHLFQVSGEILTAVREMVGDVCTSQQVAQAIGSLHKQKLLLVDRTTKQGTTAIYEPWIHHVESSCASLLHERLGTARLGRDKEAFSIYRHALSRTGPLAEDASKDEQADIAVIARAALRDWSNGSQIVLSEAQMQGATNALTASVSVLTGLPGTGKTTALKAIISVLKDAEVPFLLIAPTGIAAKRMSSVTGSPAFTVHRAFKAQGWKPEGEEREATYVGVTGQNDSMEGSDGSREQWGYSDASYPADVVVIDEMSMVDQHLLYRILSCTKPTARLVFIGDDKQLPSVGPGNVLRDLITSGLFPTVSMTEIFRQADTSQIVVAAHDISRGEVPEVSSSLADDFVLIPTQTESQTLAVVTKIASALYGKRVNFQVMSPRHAGTVGVTNLNVQLRDLLNPKQPGLQEMRLGSETIREDDRVMVVRNNYEKEIFNGDVGKVQRLDRKLREAEVKIHGPPVMQIRLPFKDAAEHLRLAYCTTVHKMQGQEADVILLPIMTTFSSQLQRNLLYTAITRAKKRVILVGQHEALVRAVANNRQDERNSLFRDRLVILQGSSQGDDSE